MTNQDRCDRCQAQAYVRVMFASGDLLFCGHHMAAYEPSFPENFAIVEDNRKELVSV